MSSLRLACLVALVLAPACASGTSIAPGDDEPSTEEPQPPGPVGSAACADGQHACGDLCVADYGDRPDLGCALGCGQPCKTPPNGVATCTAGGTCDFTCPAPYTKIHGDCVLSACEDAGYTCGSLVDDNGQTIDCGSCADGIGCGANHACYIPADTREPNDNRTQATYLGQLDDAEDPTMWIDTLSIHAAGDEDWFRFELVDGWDAGNPDGFIQLSHRMTELGWLDANHELTVWFQCATQDAGSVLQCGEWFSTTDENSLVDPALGVGCTVTGQYVVWADLAPSCTGTADGGTVTIRVRKPAAPRGDTYDLYVGVN